MKNTKFKKGDIGYFFNEGTFPFGLTLLNFISVNALAINIVEVKDNIVKGYIFHYWNSVKHMDKHTIRKMSFDKLNDLQIGKLSDYDVIKFTFSATVDKILTHDELKLKMITWIANDFSDPNDEDYLHP